MKNIIIGLFFLLPLSIFSTEKLNKYNVVWTEQSKNSSESMPCGGGDVGLNVWVENGDILFYLSRSGTFDENNAMLKLGRVRLKITPNPFNGKDFRQELVLKEGCVKINGGGVEVKIWADIFHPMVYSDIKSEKPVEVTATYENWRFEDFVPIDKEFRSNSYKFPRKDIVVKTYKDNVGYDTNDGIIFYHQNKADIEDIFDLTVRLQGMNSVKGKMSNPIKNLIFGGIMRGSNMKKAGTSQGKYINTNFKSWALQSEKPVRECQIEIGLHVAKSPDISEWKDSLSKVMSDAIKDKKTARKKALTWWQEFWNRSYIFIDGKENDPQWQVGRNYQLFRYMLACNAYADYPTKFNGGLFTFDPVNVDSTIPGTPDHRNWGGGTMTAQNQRLVYFPMFKNGDFEMLQSQFNFYLNSMRNAELRSEVYWNHKGACFTEQLENFGLPMIVEYGFNHPDWYDKGMEYNAWLEYQWETVFEFCLMMLDTERYEGRDIRQYIPFIESCLTFYDEHYQYLARMRSAKIWDENGCYVFYPTSACETYKMTYNSTTVIAALKVILTRILELPDKYSDQVQREKWDVMLKRIPALPLREIDEHKMLSPAQSWQRVQNSEVPQLYPVYPWGLYGIGKPDLEIAKNTYLYDPDVVKNRDHQSWKQYPIFAARLGLTYEAAKYTILKLQDGPYRFPAFWGPGKDWTPDHNWGGSGMIALQEMLMQVDGKKIYLLPAWPGDWNGSFKLHAPYNTTIEATVNNGQVNNLKVIPELRKNDIIIIGQLLLMH